MDMNAHRLIEGFLSPRECQAMRDRMEAIGWAPAIIRMQSGPKADARIRDSDRVEFVDEELAQRLWERAREAMDPQEMAKMCAQTTSAVGLRSWFRGYRYSPGQKFGKHRDAREREGDALITRITALIYLTDALGGDGATILHPERSDPSAPIRILPKEGALLLFDSRHLHEGEPPSCGTKWVLRSDILFPCDPASPCVSADAR